MPKLYLENGAVVEGSIDEIAELAKKLDCGEVTDGYRKISGRDPRVGDFVKFIGDDAGITVGKYYEIVEIDDDGDYRFYDDVGDKSWVSPGEDHVEFYEKVNADAGEAVTADTEPEFKVGDYVVALPSADEKYGFTNTSMNLGKIIRINGDEIRIEVVSHKHADLAGEVYDVKKEHFRKASHREVIFGKVGRKLNEFKVGDIVRIIDPHAYVNGLKGYDGLIIEIGDIDETSLPFHVIKPSFVENDTNTWLLASQIELITPVENRVDR